MKLYELVHRFSWDDVKHALIRLYPDQEANMDGYCEVLAKLKKLRHIDKDMEIVVTFVDKDPWELEEDEFVPYFSVSGKNSEPCWWALEWTPWEEWLGMDIFPKMPYLDFLVHCLWEMTYCGFSQQQVEEHVNKITTSMEECKKAIDNGDESRFYEFEEIEDELD